MRALHPPGYTAGRFARRLAVLAFGLTLAPLPALSQPIRVEIQVRNTAALDDDYLTWAPAPARIRLLPDSTPGPDRTVVLTNDPPGPIPPGRQAPLDGDVLFAASVRPGQTATQESLQLQLPGDGAWRSFVVAGKFRRPSSRDKDALIEVHLSSAGGPVVHRHALMVRIRKDARTLTVEERDRLLRAIADLHRRGGYVSFVRIHQLAGMGKEQPGDEYWPDQGHLMAGFLPWHRAYLLLFERELQKRFPDVALPYWRLREPSNLFTPSFLGANSLGSGEPVRADFAPENPLVFWKIADTPLMRFAVDRTSSDQLKGFRSEQDSLAVDDYESFHSLVEGNPHDRGHNWVGPWMQDCKISPSDPIFWIFHTEFDRLWAKWQWKYSRFGTDGSRKADYEANGAYDPYAKDCSLPKSSECIPLGHHLKDTMWPWNGLAGHGVNAGAHRPNVKYGPFPVSRVPGLWPAAPATPTPADTIDYTGLAPGRLDMGYAYDDVPYGVQPPQPAAPALAEAPAAPDAASLKAVAADPQQPEAVRAAAVQSLADADPASAIDRALAIVKDPASGAELDAESVVLLNQLMMFTRAGAPRHAEIHHALRQALTDPRQAVRNAALRVLGPAGDPVAVRLLEESLEKPQGALFPPLAAIRVLTAAGGAGHAAAVRPYLSSPVPEIRAAAVEALPQGVPGSLLPLLDLLADAGAPLTLRARAAAAIEDRLLAPTLSRQDLATIADRLHRIADLARIGPLADEVLNTVETLPKQQGDK